MFNGIGGFQLAAEWMGWENVFHCEIDDFCNEVISKYFQDSVKHGDIKTTDFRIYRGRIDVLSGGDPCQPHSVAGLGKGKADDRFLWPEKFRAIREIQPTWVVNENVNGSVANGVLDSKIDDLESIGYACQAYSIPAESVGALHQRERIWLIANNADFHRNNKVTGEISGTEETKRSLEKKQHKVYQLGEPVNLWPCDSDADIERFEKQYYPAESGIFKEGHGRYFGFGANSHGNIPRNVLESGIIRMLDGLPEGMDYADRNKRIKGLGNAIVWQVAYEIFKAIEDFEK